MKNYNDRKNALMYVDAVSFAALDSAMFLDTHPDDPEAMEFFKHYNNLSNQAIAEYSKRFTPLTISNAGCVKSWNEWVETPWPWEGGSC